MFNRKVVVAIMATLAVLVLVSGCTSSTQPAGQTLYDSYSPGCGADAEIVEGHYPVYDRAGNVQGQLRVYRSHKCSTVWATIDDVTTEGQEFVLVLIDKEDKPLTTDVGKGSPGAPFFSRMVRYDLNGCVWATGYVPSNPDAATVTGCVYGDN